MDNLLASPGMLTTFVLILVIEAVSLLVLIINVQVFRTKAAKYQALYSGFGGSSFWSKPGRILVPLYVLISIGIAIVSMVLFIWQPHVL